jgi:hypothetical protein
VKYNYCPKCDKAYVKSRLEKDRCIYCNSPAETVDVRRNGLYYLGYGIMLGGAASAMLPRLAAVSEPNLYIILGVALVIAGTAFVLMGGARMARAAKDVFLEERAEK